MAKIDLQYNLMTAEQCLRKGRESEVKVVALRVQLLLFLELKEKSSTTLGESSLYISLSPSVPFYLL